MTTIQVTRADIAAGIPTDPSSCAVALAIGPHYPGCRVWVTAEDIHLVAARPDAGPSRDVPTPPEVREWIAEYDRCTSPEECPEITFTLPE